MQSIAVAVRAAVQGFACPLLLFFWMLSLYHRAAARNVHIAIVWSNSGINSKAETSWAECMSSSCLVSNFRIKWTAVQCTYSDWPDFCKAVLFNALMLCVIR